MVRWPLVLPLLVALAPTPAFALKPGKHRSIAEASCKAARLPDAFCRRMGKAVYETDYNEWEDLSAHAQTQRGQDRCTAADAAASRVDRLARSVIASARANDVETAAVDLGRALHTIQDECAHHGMTNEEHAFLSIEQTCGDEDVSPDIQPAAIACATQRTTAVMNLVAPALAGTNWSYVDDICHDRFGDDRNRDTCSNAALPTPVMACEFLGLFRQWDGADSTWNSDIVGPALTEAFANGVRGVQASTSVCARGSIDPTSPHGATSTNGTCGLIGVGCLGKVDNDADVDPYGEEPASTSGGCSTGRAGWFPALFALLLLRRRRR